MRIPIMGEYIARDWRVGIEMERNKSIKAMGLKSYFAHINDVIFMGDKPTNRVDGFSRHRMHKMRVSNMNSLEVVRETIPIYYETEHIYHEFVGMIERKVPMYRHIYYGYVDI